MKKQYHKPALYAETFELAEHIARCAPPNAEYSRANYSDAGSCGFDIGASGDGSNTVFTNSNCALASLLDEGDSWQTLQGVVVCYNSFFDFAASYTMFSS